MFSVVIPLYNKSEYISKTIDSVLAQTFQEYELIVVNDGSTDNSLEKVKQFHDTKIKIVNQTNSGVSTARNNGVKIAKYDYIAFLDADDWWCNDFLKEMSHLVHQYSEAAIFASSYYRVKNGKNKKANIGVDEGFEQGYINYFKVYSNTFWTPVNCSFVVVRKDSFIKENGFDPNLKFGEDFDLWLRMALNNKVALVNKCLAFSNQDVSNNNRALGDKIWKKEEHFLFNMGYIETIEKNNKDLKFLLDGLRVRCLIHYFRKQVYINELKVILNNIDFDKQAFIYRFLYNYPKILSDLYFWIKNLWSQFGNQIFRHNI